MPTIVAKLVVVLLALTLTACSKLTLENYGKLKVGMAFEEVKTLLGDPGQCSEALAIKGCQWGDDTKNIKVNFVADKAVLFSAHKLN